MNKFLRAITMPELLMVMVISGIIFIAVLDGLGLFQRYASDTSARISDNSRFYENFHRLDGLISEADSVLSLDEMVITYRLGRQQAVLLKVDSLLLVITNLNDAFAPPDKSDTLLTRVVKFYGVPNRIHKARLDTVKLILATGNNDNIAVAFPAVKIFNDAAIKKIEELEKEYLYE